VGYVVETALHVRLYPEYLLGDIYLTDTISSAVFLQEHAMLTSQVKQAFAHSLHRTNPIIQIGYRQLEIGEWITYQVLVYGHEI
jgi:hypothetical protein